MTAAGLCGLAVIASLIWLAATREGLVYAAARLDEAARLRERLSTGLHCARMDEPFARAVVQDANRLAATIHVPAHLPVLLPRSAPWAGGTLLVAAIIALMLPNMDLRGKTQERLEDKQRDEAVKREQARIQPLVKKQLEQLSKANPALATAMAPPEPMAMAKPDSPDQVRQAALKQINAVRQNLGSRTEDPRLGKVDDLKRMLRQLNAVPPSKSPVGELAKAMAAGDFQAAAEASKALANELDKQATTPEAQQKAQEIRGQLKQLADAVNKAAESNQSMRNELSRSGMNSQELAKAMEAISSGNTSALQKMLAEKGLSQSEVNSLMKKAASNAAAQQAAKKLAAQMAKAAQEGQKQAGQKGQKGEKGEKGEQGEKSQQGQKGEQGQEPGESPGEGMSQAAEQLSELESLQQELGEISSAMEGLDGLQGQLDGNGQGDGQGNGQGEGQGLGMGTDSGQGEGGVAPVAPAAFKTANKRTPVKTVSGSIISQSMVDGEQYKGELSQDFVDAVLGAREDRSEVTRRKEVPQHIRLRQSEYFSHAYKDLPAEKVKQAEQKAEQQAPPAPQNANENK